MPIIFAQSLMLFPGVLLGWLDGWSTVRPAARLPVSFLNDEFSRGGFIYIMTRSRR